MRIVLPLGNVFREILFASFSFFEYFVEYDFLEQLFLSMNFHNLKELERQNLTEVKCQQLLTKMNNQLIKDRDPEELKLWQ